MAIDNIDQTATAMGCLGSPSRIRIVDALNDHGTTGATVGMLQAALDIPWSTLSHHISKLRDAGLITQQRHGREIYCRIAPDAIGQLLDALHNLRPITEQQDDRHIETARRAAE